MRHKFMQCVEDPDQFDVDTDPDFGVRLVFAQRDGSFLPVIFCLYNLSHQLMADRG